MGIFPVIHKFPMKYLKLKNEKMFYRYKIIKCVYKRKSESSSSRHFSSHPLTYKSIIIKKGVVKTTSRQEPTPHHVSLQKQYEVHHSS